jgi:hypothetical protein
MSALRDHVVGRNALLPHVCRVLGLAVASAGVFAASAAEGSHIRTTHHVHQSSTGSVWEDYFRQALATHSLHVRVPLVLRDLKAENGLLPETAFVSYLRWRRSLNTARFDRFHPHVAAMLNLDQQVRQALLQPPPTIPTTPTVPPYVPNPSPENPIPPPVPEPSTALIGAVILALIAGVRLRHSWQAR